MDERVFQERPRRSQKDRMIAWMFAVGFMVAAIMLCIGSYLLINDKPVIVVEVPAPTPTPALVASASGEMAAPVAADSLGEALAEEMNLVPFAWLVGIGLAAFVFYKVVIETGFWKIILGLGAAGLVVAGLFWVLLYRGGDVSTADARDANLQVVKVVQPVGDPSVDQAYAGVNRENAGTNIVNAGSNSIYTILFLGVMVVVIGCAIVLHYYINRSGDLK